MENILKYDVSVMDLNFTAEENDFGKNNTYELVNNGKNIMVTEENKHKFVEIYSQWKLVESVRPQIEYMLAGLYEIIPRPYFSIFSEKELELLLCGTPKIDIQDWKKNTKYSGFNPDDKVVQIFWEMVEEMKPADRSKLLQFVTGVALLPSEGFEGLNPPFTICKLRASSKHLPVAHTW